MHGMHVSPRVVGIVEEIAAGGFVTAVALLSVIAAATLFYVWVIA